MYWAEPPTSPPEQEHYEACPCHEDNTRWDDDTFDCECECDEIAADIRDEIAQHRDDIRRGK